MKRVLRAKTWVYYAIMSYLPEKNRMENAEDYKMSFYTEESEI